MLNHLPLSDLAPSWPQPAEFALKIKTYNPKPIPLHSRGYMKGNQRAIPILFRRDFKDILITNSYYVRGLMDWLSNMAFFQDFPPNASFFIVFAQYFFVFTALDIWAVP